VRELLTHFILIDLKWVIRSFPKVPAAVTLLDGPPLVENVWMRGDAQLTRLTDLPPDQAKRLAELECPDFETRPWVTGPALSHRRVAIVSSAGLVVRGENPFRGRDPDYRAIPSTVAAGDLLCSHISINFDRTGFQEDWNVIFPLDRLNELAAEGKIGSVAATHYSFMGATDPVQMEPHARGLAGRLKADTVDAVVLPPV
jgi:D-proline reductase (dithiol) PrdB